MFLPVEVILLGTTDKQKEKILPREIAIFGMVCIPSFLWLLGRWRWDPPLSDQKEVGRSTELWWGWGHSAAPGDLVFRPEEFPTEVGGKTWFCFGFWKDLAIFLQCWFNKTQNCFSWRFSLHFLSHSICAKKGTTCAFDSFTFKSSLLPWEIACLRNL